MGVIKEDQKAKLFFKLADNSEKEFDCLVKDVYKDRLSLKFPTEILAYAEYLEEGSELPVKIFTPSGIRAFDTIVLNSPLESEFVIEYVEDHIEIQRREHTRAELEAKVIITRETGAAEVTHTLDISGGGIKFFSEESYNPDEELECMLYLPYQMRSIRAKGKILANSHIPPKQHVLLFSEISENDRDKIVKACFEMQTGKYKGNQEESEAEIDEVEESKSV